jgi:hypothetical protein
MAKKSKTTSKGVGAKKAKPNPATKPSFAVSDWADAGAFIDAETAGRGHKQWRRDNGILHDPDDDPTYRTVRANYFSASKVQELLNQNGCKGIRIYHCTSIGMIGNKRMKYRDVFLMPTDENGNDMVPIKEWIRKPGRPIPHGESRSALARSTSSILNASKPCPDYCSPS